MNTDWGQADEGSIATEPDAAAEWGETSYKSILAENENCSVGLVERSVPEEPGRDGEFHERFQGAFSLAADGRSREEDEEDEDVEFEESDDEDEDIDEEDFDDYDDEDEDDDDLEEEFDDDED